MSKLYFITSKMGGGKSTQLLAKEFNYRENGLQEMRASRATGLLLPQV